MADSKVKIQRAKVPKRLSHALGMYIISQVFRSFKNMSAEQITKIHRNESEITYCNVLVTKLRVRNYFMAKSEAKTVHPI